MTPAGGDLRVFFPVFFHLRNAVAGVPRLTLLMTPADVSEGENNPTGNIWRETDKQIISLRRVDQSLAGDAPDSQRDKEPGSRSTFSHRNALE